MIASVTRRDKNRYGVILSDSIPASRHPICSHTLRPSEFRRLRGHLCFLHYCGNRTMSFHYSIRSFLDNPHEFLDFRKDFVGELRPNEAKLGETTVFPQAASDRNTAQTWALWAVFVVSGTVAGSPAQEKRNRISGQKRRFFYLRERCFTATCCKTASNVRHNLGIRKMFYIFRRTLRRRKSRKTRDLRVPPAGFEPAAYGLGNRRSIP